MQLSLVLQHSIGDPNSGSTDTHQILFIAKFTQMSATAILPRCLSLSLGVYVNNGKFNPKLWYYIAIDSIRGMLRWSASNRSFIVHRTIALCVDAKRVVWPNKALMKGVYPGVLALLWDREIGVWYIYILVVHLSNMSKNWEKKKRVDQRGIKIIIGCLWKDAWEFKLILIIFAEYICTKCMLLNTCDWKRGYAIFLVKYIVKWRDF